MLSRRPSEDILIGRRPLILCHRARREQQRANYQDLDLSGGDQSSHGIYIHVSGVYFAFHPMVCLQWR